MIVVLELDTSTLEDQIDTFEQDSTTSLPLLVLLWYCNLWYVFFESMECSTVGKEITTITIVVKLHSSWRTTPHKHEESPTPFKLETYCVLLSKEDRTLFRSTTMLCGTHNILQNISHIQIEMRNLLQNIVNATQLCYGFDSGGLVFCWSSNIRANKW